MDNCFLEGISYFGSNMLTNTFNEGFSTMGNEDMMSAMKCLKSFVIPFCFGSHPPYFIDVCLTKSSMLCCVLAIIRLLVDSNEFLWNNYSN